MKVLEDFGKHDTKENNIKKVLWLFCNIVIAINASIIKAMKKVEPNRDGTKILELLIFVGNSNKKDTKFVVVNRYEEVKDNTDPFFFESNAEEIKRNNNLIQHNYILVTIQK